MKKDLNIEWLKCPHGVLKSQRCSECEIVRQNYLTQLIKEKDKQQARIPIKRGCRANGACFCDGSCQEIIGYRDPIFPGEKP